MNKSLLFKNAHKITKKIVNKYGVNYNTQLGISLKSSFNVLGQVVFEFESVFA